VAFSIDPNVKGYINVALAVCGAIAAVGVGAFPSYIPTSWATDTVQTAGFVMAVYGFVNAGGNFFSSSKPGLLAPPDSAVVLAAQKVADLPPTATPGAIMATKAAATSAIVSHNP
jgi:hypothetical protein